MKFQKGHKINKGKTNVLGKHWNLSNSTKLKMSLSSKGKLKSKEHKIAISKGKKGIKRSEETKKRISEAKKGIKKSEEHKVKIGLSMKGRKNPEHSKRMSGENGLRYIKDRTKLKKSDDRRKDVANKDWRLKVFLRDNRNCQMYNEECIGKLEVHHILNWIDNPNLRYDINNGITLCHFHHPRGRVMEKKMVEYLQKLINNLKTYGDN